MKLNIQRFTLTGAEHAFTFNHERSNYIVKNFTEGDIFVAFESGAEEDESIKIPSGMGQICTIDCVPETTGATARTVYVTGTGEVEVQQI